MTDLVALVDKLIGPAIAALLTVMVLSYLIGDNPLFRLAMHLFVGVAAGYAGALAIRSVFLPALVQPILETGFGGLLNPAFLLTTIIPAFLSLLLLMKIAPGTARLGSVVTAFLVGVGAAVVVGGAITGTLIPQSVAAMTTMSPAAVSPQTGETGLERMLNVTILLVGTITTLAYFRFTTSRRALSEEMAGGPFHLLRRVVSSVGRGFIALAFGVMYAGTLTATLLILSDRIQFLWSFVTSLVSGP